MVPKWLQMLSLSQVQLGGCPGVREAKLNGQFIRPLFPSESRCYCIFVSISRQSHLPRFVRLFLLLIRPLQGVLAADGNDYWPAMDFRWCISTTHGSACSPAGTALSLSCCNDREGASIISTSFGSSSLSVQILPFEMHFLLLPSAHRWYVL